MRIRFVEHDTLEVLAPAKVNLFLEVLGKRPDGYHELSTVMMGISLCDRLRLRKREDNQLRLHVEVPRHAVDSPQWDIPSDSSNLVMKAMDAVRKLDGHQQGMDVWLWKGIPSQAGLGGGSSDAAAAIVASMVLWRKNYDAAVASDLASQLGSDINFFVDGLGSGHAVARCTSRGEEVQPIMQTSQMHLMVVQPPEGCSTRSVFQRLSLNGKKTPINPVISAWEQRNVSQLGASLFNRLEEAACEESVWIRTVKDELDREATLGHVMSGSGSAQFALCRTKMEAQRLALRLSSRLPVSTFWAREWRQPPLSAQLRSIGI